jgi:hypothetical protein
MNHLDIINRDKGYRAFRIFSAGTYYDLLVPHESFKARNIELKSKNVNFTVVGGDADHSPKTKAQAKRRAVATQ